MSHRISQVDGNSSEPDDKSLPEVVESEPILDLHHDSPPQAVYQPVAGVGIYHSKALTLKTKPIKSKRPFAKYLKVETLLA